MKRRFLASLDALLDTRAGVLNTLDPRYLEVILNNGNQYFNRVIDDFEWIEPGLTAKFAEAYANRKSPEILANSFRTVLVNHLVQQVVSLMLSAGEHPEWDGMTIDINTHPYELTQDQINWFRDIIREAIVGDPTEDGRLLFDLEVRMVNISLEELTVERIGSNWETVYFYDFIAWTDCRAADLNGQEMKGVHSVLTIPALFRTLPDRKLLKTKDGGVLNPFHETQRNFSLWVQLKYVNPRIFSIPDPNDKGGREFSQPTPPSRQKK